jgi:hypothetical protein
MSESLQFDHAETTGGTSCAQCQTTLQGSYFQAGGAMLCDGCVGSLRQALAGQGSSAGRFLRAVLLGLGAMLVGAIGYGLWMGFTNSEFALVTIAIGWFVGKAVRHGSGGRGGWRYGLLAVVLTYCAIAFSFFGAAVAEMRNKPATPIASGETAKDATAPAAVEAGPTAVEPSADASEQEIGLLAGVIALLVFAFSIPVLSATQSILSLIITGFGLWQAWSMNRAANVEITGPHRLGAEPKPASA